MNSILKYIYGKGKTKICIHQIDPDNTHGNYWVSNGVFSIVSSYADLTALKIIDYVGNIVDKKDLGNVTNLRRISEECHNSTYNVCEDTGVIIYAENKYNHYYNDGTRLIGVDDLFVQEVRKHAELNKISIEFYTINKELCISPILFFGDEITEYPLGFILPRRCSAEITTFIDKLKINGEIPSLFEGKQEVKHKTSKGLTHRFRKIKTMVLQPKTEWKSIDEIEEWDLPF